MLNYRCYFGIILALLSSLHELIDTLALLIPIKAGFLLRHELITIYVTQRTLGLTSYAGKYAFQSERYHGANDDESMHCLFQYLQEIQMQTQDELLHNNEVLDTLYHGSIQEYFLSARDQLSELQKNVCTLKDLLNVVSFVGILVKQDSFCDGIQFTPWLFSVKETSQVLPFVTTYDLLVTGEGQIQSQNEVAGDCLILLGGLTGGSKIYSHVQSYLLTKNWSLNFPEARLAAVGGLVANLLMHSDCMTKDWIQSLLQLAQHITAFRPGGWKGLLTGPAASPLHCLRQGMDWSL